MSLDLKNAEYHQSQGHSLLFVEIDGVEAILNMEWKPTLREHGIVAVEQFINIWPPFVFELDGRKVEIPGGTDDRRLVALYSQFWHDENKKFGPVPIPD